VQHQPTAARLAGARRRDELIGLSGELGHRRGLLGACERVERRRIGTRDCSFSDWLGVEIGALRRCSATEQQRERENGAPREPFGAVFFTVRTNGPRRSK
jgi:hypothetical protein